MADNNLTTKEEFLLNPVEEHNITNAAIASFETNLKHPLKVTVRISPKQDLHGMPSPYPAGVSVNLIPDGTDTSNGYVDGCYLENDNTTTELTGYYISEFFPVDKNTTYTWSNTIGTILNPAICFYDENKDFISGITPDGIASKTFIPPEGAVYARSSQTHYTASSFAKFQLEVGSTATAYKRYSNICPIDGFSGCRTSNDPKYAGFIKWNQLANIVSSAWSKTRSTVSFDGTVMTIKPTTSLSLKQAYIRVQNNHTFFVRGILKKETLAAGFYVGTYKPADSEFNERYYVSTGKEDKLFKYIVHTTGSRTAVTFNLATTVSSSQNCILDKVQILDLTEMFGAGNEPSTVVAVESIFPNDYYEYNSGEETCISAVNGDPHFTFPITFTDPSTGNPMTVYGGTLTLNEDGSADVVSEYGLFTSNSSSGWTYTNGGFWHDNAMSTAGVTESGKFLCNKYIAATSVNTSDNVPGRADFTFFNQSNKVVNRPRLWIKDSTLNGDLSALNTALAANPLQVVYPLATPQTYHFSNVGQLKAFLGTNNIWSDIGNVNVKYLTQNSATGLEYRGDRALELRRRAMIGDAPTIHTTIGSEETGGLASFKSYIKAPVKKIEIPFGPKQDLHGYDHPWPAGGGKNLFPYPFVDTTKTVDGITFTDLGNGQIKVSGTSTASGYTNFILQRGIDFGSEYHNFSYVSKTYTVDSKTLDMDGLVSGIGGYYSDGSVVMRVTAGATVNCTVSPMIYDASSPLTSFVPYANICPIEGHDGAIVGDNGKNIFGGYPFAQAFLSDINTVNKTGNFYLSNPPVVIYDKFKPNTQYTVIITYSNTANNTSLLFRYSDNSVSNIYCNNSSGNKTTVALTSTAGKTVKSFELYYYAVSVTTCYYDESGIFEGKLSVADYKPYVEQSIPLIFNQSGDHSFTPIQEGTGDPSPENVRPIHPGLTFTRDNDSVLSVYGGTLTVNADGTGSIVATHDLKTFTGTNENWVLNGNPVNNVHGYRILQDYSDIVWGATAENGSSNIMVSSQEAYTKASPNKFAINSSYVMISVYDIDTIDGLKTWLNNNNLQICYPLITPITYTLSVTETNRALEALGLTKHIGPIYGGTVTINPDGSADVVSEYGIFTADGSNDEQWTYTSGVGGGSFIWQNTGAQASYYYDDPRSICNNLKKVKLTDGLFGALIGTTAANNELWILCATSTLGIDNVTSFREWLAVNQVSFTAKLATPQTYHFSNLEQLKVWLGENNFWCDISDDITVKYWNRG